MPKPGLWFFLLLALGFGAMLALHVRQQHQLESLQLWQQEFFIEPVFPEPSFLPDYPEQLVVHKKQDEWIDVLALVTAYTPGEESCEDSADGRTAINRCTYKYPYGIAADPAVLPYGTLIRVPGYLNKSFPDKAWEVDDTGGAMRQSWRRGVVHIDLRYRHVPFAMRIGKTWRVISVSTKGLSSQQISLLKSLQHKEIY